ncbi:hypothetical protein C7M84_011752 [Penaeus vannamei]|uniref:Uncharacterized protein n=1 Tax=Penaeus vannamei TaxID=6689 RepID=A0A423T0K0_PENVA|nr:hypothetical protein C7M84_011752 [Penaeus vannamei]
MEAWESLLRRPLATTGRAREAPAGSRRGRVSGAASVVAFAGHLSGDAAVSRAAAPSPLPPPPLLSVPSPPFCPLPFLPPPFPFFSSFYPSLLLLSVPLHVLHLNLCPSSPLLSLPYPPPHPSVSTPSPSALTSPFFPPPPLLPSPPLPLPPLSALTSPFLPPSPSPSALTSPFSPPPPPPVLPLKFSRAALCVHVTHFLSWRPRFRLQILCLRLELNDRAAYLVGGSVTGAAEPRDMDTGLQRKLVQGSAPRPPRAPFGRCEPTFTEPRVASSGGRRLAPEGRRTPYKEPLISLCFAFVARRDRGCGRGQRSGQGGLDVPLPEVFGGALACLPDCAGSCALRRNPLQMRAGKETPLHALPGARKQAYFKYI